MSILLQLAAGNAQADSTMNSMALPIMMGVMLLFMFFQFRSSRKREKAEQELRANLDIGDEIITIGGIVGKVVTVREEDVIIETGADRTKMKILRTAIHTNKTKTEQHQREVEAAKAAAKEKKNKKSKDADVSSEK